MNVMISINDKFLEIAKVMLYSLFYNNRDTSVDLYLICHDLSENTVNELEKLVSQFEAKRLHVVDIGSHIENDIPLYVSYSPEILYKILGIDYLPRDIHKILWLDADMIVKGDITDLYNTDITGAPMAVCEDINAVLNSESEEFKVRCKMPPDSKYFNAGMCLINLDYMRQRNFTATFRDVINHRHEEYPFLEQDALNNMLFDDVAWLPWSLYNTHPGYYILSIDDACRGIVRMAPYREVNRESAIEGYLGKYRDVTNIIKNNSKIIHYIGLSKPWRADSDNMYWTQAAFKDIWLSYRDMCEGSMKQNGIKDN